MSATLSAADCGRLSRAGTPPPRPVEQRIDAYTDANAIDKVMAKLVAGHLNGIAPGDLSAEERAALDGYGPENVGPALRLLAAVDYGPHLYRSPKPLQQRAHGLDRERRLDGVIGRLPRALALRMPTTAETRRTGPVHGRDRWGQVSCSKTLRPAHLGLVGALCGLWSQRASDQQPWVGCTAGELTQLLTGRTRHGGRDLETIHRLLADLEQLELTATGKDLDVQYRIPSTPIARVQRRIGDRWVAASEYLDAITEDSTRSNAEGQIQVAVDELTCGPETIRVHLAEWVLAELRHGKRRPVYLDLDIWAHLRPQATRLYAFLQAQSRDSYDKGLYFYLADPTRFTLGLRGRLDRCGQSVSADLAAIVKADRRYERFRRHTHANTKYPAFGVQVRDRTSQATELAKTVKSEPKRSRLIDRLDALRRQSQRAASSGPVPLRDFQRIAAAVSRGPEPPTRPRRPALRRQLLYAPPDAATAPA